MSQVSENPFKNSDTNKRYYTYDYYLRHTFSEKCAKITLDAGFTCPNIDGYRGVGGCIYCSGGSASRCCDGLLPLKEQYESQKAVILKKWAVKSFIPYLQAFTNSYTSPDNFERILTEVASFDGAVMINIATRADCLEDEKIEILNSVSKTIPVTVELGLQSSDDKTAELINRCHTYSEFTDCFSRLRQGAPNVKIAVHIINGLPGESREDMLYTARKVAELSPAAVKIHLLHVIRGTALEKEYSDGGFEAMTLEDYVAAVCDQLELLPTETVIERLTGDGAEDSLIAPLWSKKKLVVQNEIDKELLRRNSYQGITH